MDTPTPIRYALIGRDGKGIWYTITTASGDRGLVDLQRTRVVLTARTDYERRTIGAANKRTTGDRNTLPVGTLRAFRVVVITANLGQIMADGLTELLVNA